MPSPPHHPQAVLSAGVGILACSASNKIQSPEHCRPQEQSHPPIYTLSLFKNHKQHFTHHLHFLVTFRDHFNITERSFLLDSSILNGIGYFGKITDVCFPFYPMKKCRHPPFNLPWHPNACFKKELILKRNTYFLVSAQIGDHLPRSYLQVLLPI